MEKSPDAFRTISEVAGALSVPPHVLRFWESRFPQVKPVKRGGGRRYYRPDDISLLRGIRSLLYDDGMTIKGVQKILRERGIRHVVALGTLPNGADGAVDEARPEAPAPAAAALAAKPRKAKPAAPKPDAPSLAEPEATPAPAPQADLFPAAPAHDGRATPPAPAPAGARPPARDKAALRALLVELQALRDVMAAEPEA